MLDRSGSARLRVCALLAVGAVVVGLGGCGDDDAPRTQASVPQRPCELSAIVVAQALREDATLLRYGPDACVYGAERAEKKADRTKPVAWIERPDALPAPASTGPKPRGPKITGRARPDIDQVAWQRDWYYRNGRHRTQLAFVRPKGGFWAVTVDLPRGAHNDDDALEMAESLHDALIDPTAYAES